MSILPIHKQTMIPVTHELANEMSLTNRLMCHEMLRRGWTVSIPYRFHYDLTVDRGRSGGC